ncbi:MAG: cytochrome c [Cyclobacteriaceae bacterium]|nr:cytochrome c [Cyclobacteriaceae bacterium]
MKRTLIIFLLLTPFFFSFDQTFDLKASMERGKSIYEAQCITCHMAEGEGLAGVFPPLAKADYLADKNRLVKVVLQGVRGEMKVNGTDYNGEMTGFSLSDQETADVLNYICNTWGNNAAAIKPADIQPALKATSKNYQPY